MMYALRIGAKPGQLQILQVSYQSPWTLAEFIENTTTVEADIYQQNQERTAADGALEEDNQEHNNNTGRLLSTHNSSSR